MSDQKTSTGLARAHELYSHRSQRARELKAEGRKIVGYFCCYPPLELMTALDFVPVRILGDMDEPITVADGYLPTVMCIFYRSCFDVGMKGKYDYFDAFVGSHACDGAERTAHIWRNYMKTPCSFMLDVPHVSSDEAIEFFKGQMNYFKEALEKFAGKKVTDDRLEAAIALHNQQRQLVRQLYDLRKPDPPLISGSEVLEVLIALMVIPVEEGINLLEEVIQEVKDRPLVTPRRPGRLLVWGSLMDHTAFTQLIENSGFNIVVEDTAIGARPFWHDIESVKDPMYELAKHYLREVKCPRTFGKSGANYKADLENRFGYLREFAKYWNVNSIYANIIRNCDPHGYEVPSIKDYFESLNLPILVVEHDYSTAALEPLRTRIQAFAESVG